MQLLSRAKKNKVNYLFSNCHFAVNEKTLDVIVKPILKNKDLYESTALFTKPLTWYVIALMHLSRCNGSFDHSIIDGEKLTDSNCWYKDACRRLPELLDYDTKRFQFDNPAEVIYLLDTIAIEEKYRLSMWGGTSISPESSVIGLATILKYLYKLDPDLFK